MDFALYDPQTDTATPMALPREGHRLEGLGPNGSLRRIADKTPDRVREFAPTIEDAKAGRYFVPVTTDPAQPIPGPGERLGDPTLKPTGDPVVALSLAPIIPADPSALRTARKLEIDATTGARIVGNGFAHAGDVWPLDATMQTNLIGIMGALTAALLAQDPAAEQTAILASIPPWGNLADTATITFDSIDGFKAFHRDAFAQVAAERAAGRALKDLIDAAKTPAEILAVVDPRPTTDPLAP